MHNPVGAFLPGSQASMEREWKRELAAPTTASRSTALFTLTNMPISRFLEWLDEIGQPRGYMARLVDAFNPAAVAGVMCRNTLSVGWDGTLYDCDFNQMLDLAVGCAARPSAARARLRSAPRLDGAPDRDRASLLRLHGGRRQLVRRRDHVTPPPRLLPDDTHNRTLVQNAHPAGWRNPEPAGRYNLVVVGAGTRGARRRRRRRGLGARVALVERHLMGGDCLVTAACPRRRCIRSRAASSGRSVTRRRSA